MIEFARVPLDQDEGPAQMLQVARSARVFFRLPLHRDGVVPTASLQAGANLAMTFIALERRLSRREHVTRGAAKRTVPLRVGVGQWSG